MQSVIIGQDFFTGHENERPARSAPILAGAPVLLGLCVASLYGLPPFT